MHVMIRQRTDQREKSCLRKEGKKKKVGDGDGEERRGEAETVFFLGYSF